MSGLYWTSATECRRVVAVKEILLPCHRCISEVGYLVWVQHVVPAWQSKGNRDQLCHGIPHSLKLHVFPYEPREYS